MHNRQDTAAAARPLQSAIDELVRTTEADFLRAGTSLAAAVDRFETLEAAARDVATLSDRIEGVAEATQRLDDDLRKATEETRRGLAPLPEIPAIGAELDEHVAALSQRVRTMRVVSINARVIIATMTSGPAGLSRFADEVRDVGAEIEAVLAQVGAALVDLRSSSLTVSTSCARLESISGDATIRALARLTENLGHYEGALDHLTASGGALATRSERLRRAVMAAVVALQAGDALRQRLEHCSAILEAAFTAAGEPEARRLLLLTRCQIEDLAGRHRVEVGNAAGALQEARTEAHHFLDEISELVPKPDGPGTTLHAAIRSVCALLEQCRAETDALHAGAASMTERMHDMLESMTEFAALGERIRYIALNAVIACSGLGKEGDPLKAISGQLRELAEDAIGRRNEMQELIGRLETRWLAVQEGLAASEALRGSVSGTAGDIERQLDDLHAQLATQGQRIESARDGLNEHIATGCTALERHVDAFSRIGDLTRQTTPASVPCATLDAAESQTIDRIRALLTIEQERRVHDECLRTVTGDAPAAAPAPAAPPSLDDILFA